MLQGPVAPAIIRGPAAAAAGLIQENEIMRKYLNAEFDDVDHGDYPDFCDAFITYAEHVDGTPLTDDELDALNEDRDTVHEMLWDHLY